MGLYCIIYNIYTEFIKEIMVVKDKVVSSIRQRKKGFLIDKIYASIETLE